MHSADRVLPEFQHPQLGDTIVFGSSTMRLERVEPDHLISWRSADGSWVWTFVIARDGDGTRLISRNRYRLATIAARLGMLPMEPASLVMEQKMLRGIKQRAERLADLTPSLRLSEDDRTRDRRAPRSPQTTTAAAGGPGG
jgi:hypothetical protein